MKSVLAPVFSVIACLTIVCLSIPLCAIGQNPATSHPEQSAGRQAGEGPSEIKGFNEYENFRGMVNSFGSLLKLDSTLGYDFNRHVVCVCRLASLLCQRFQRYTGANPRA